jgi:hypothetical protein
MSSVSSIQKSVSNIDLSEGDSSPDKLNLSLLPSTVPSLCIPRVYKNISREKIMRIFDELKLGSIEQIDIISIKNGGVGTDRHGSMDAGKFNRVFIHMKWNTSENSNKVRERLLSDKEIKILYEDPWFWKVRANRSQNSAPTDRPATAPASQQTRPNNPVLDFEDESEDEALRQRKAQQQQQQQQKQYQARHPYQGQGQPRNHPQDARAQRYWQQQEYENEHREFARRNPAYSDPRNSSTYDGDKEYGRPHNQQPNHQQQNQQQYQQKSKQYPRPPLAKTHSPKAPRPVQRFRAISPSFPPPSTPPTVEAPQLAKEEKQQEQDLTPSTVEPVVSTERDIVNGAIGLADASDLSFNQNNHQLEEEEEEPHHQQPIEGADTVFAVDYGSVDPNITIRRKKRIVIKK